MPENCDQGIGLNGSEKKRIVVVFIQTRFVLVAFNCLLFFFTQGHRAVRRAARRRWCISPTNIYIYIYIYIYTPRVNLFIFDVGVRRAARRAARIGLYKIFVYFEAVVHESTILSSLPAHLHCPPWCNTIAQSLDSIRLPFQATVCMLYTTQYW